MEAAKKAQMKTHYTDAFVEQLKAGPIDKVKDLVSAILGEDKAHQQLYPAQFQGAFICLVQELYETSDIDHKTMLKIYNVFLEVYNLSKPNDLTIVTSDGQRIQTNKLSLMMQSPYFAKECKGKSEIALSYTGQEVQLLLDGRDIPSTDATKLVKIIEIAAALELMNKQVPAHMELARKMLQVEAGDQEEALWTVLSGSSSPLVRRVLFDAVVNKFANQPSPFVRIVTNDSFGFALCSSTMNAVHTTDYPTRFACQFVYALYLDSVTSNSNTLCDTLALPSAIRSHITTWVVDLATITKHDDRVKSLLPYYPKLTNTIVNKNNASGHSNQLKDLFPRSMQVVVFTPNAEYDRLENTFRELPWEFLNKGHRLFAFAAAHDSSGNIFARAQKHSMLPGHLEAAYSSKLIEETNPKTLAKAVVESKDIVFPNAFLIALMHQFRFILAHDSSTLTLAMSLYRQFASTYLESDLDFVIGTRNAKTVRTHSMPFLFYSLYFRTNFKLPFEVELPFSEEALRFLIQILQGQSGDYSNFTVTTLCELLPHLKTYQMTINFRKILMQELQKRFLAANESDKAILWKQLEQHLTMTERTSILSQTDEYKLLSLESSPLSSTNFAIDGENLLFLSDSSNFHSAQLMQNTDAITVTSENLATTASRILAIQPPSILKQIRTLVVKVANSFDAQLLKTVAASLPELENIVYLGIKNPTYLPEIKAVTYVSLTSNSVRGSVPVHVMQEVQKRGWKIINQISFDANFEGDYEPLFYPSNDWSFTQYNYDIEARRKKIKDNGDTAL